MKEISEQVLQSEEEAFIFIYSRFCGTCHVARGFLQKIENTHREEIFYEMNASLHPTLLQSYQIESVPCLLIIKDGEVKEKIYTFYSIGNIYQYLYEYYPALFQ